MCTRTRTRSAGPRRAARGFTVVELLVAIGIIAVLLALLLPVLHVVRRAAHGTACLATLNEWGRATQAYAGGNRGKAFANPDGVTARPWFEVLQPYVGDVPRMLRCPAADGDPGNIPGSASQPWGPERTYDTGAPQWAVRGTYVGAYGFNGWLGRPVGAGPRDPRALDLPVRSSASVPLIGDCIVSFTMPLDTDGVPRDLENPIPRHGSGLTGPAGWLAYSCIDRHRMAINLVFVDGHAERVPLAKLWRLQWNATFVARDVSVPTQ